MTPDQIRTTALDVLRTVLKCEVDATTSRKNQPRWDSLKHLEVVFALEDELSLRYDADELPALDSVEAIVRISMRRHAP